MDFISGMTMLGLLLSHSTFTLLYVYIDARGGMEIFKSGPCLERLGLHSNLTLET